YFSNRHLLTNIIFIAVFIGGVFSWMNTNKEEYPDLTLDRIRISTFYPGASPEEVEHFVTRPIEDELRGLDGIYQITSNTSVGSSTITVELEVNYPDKDEAITEIRNTVLDVDLPGDIIEDPKVRVFKTSKKAIIDVCLFHKDKHLLDYESRNELQTYAHALENQLLNLSEVNSINKSGYIQEEFQIHFYPEKLIEYQISLADVINEIKFNHVRQPAGSLENSEDEKVTLKSELDSPEKLSDLIIQGGFDGHFIRLKDVAEINKGYEKSKSILKINGHEGVILNVVKNSSYGILEAIKTVDKAVKEFDQNILQNSKIQIVVLDDESEGVRNRLSIIGMNGAIGFTLILIMLFVFLNFRSGIWVAMGIPFTFCFTMIYVNLMGYTINNMTLAGVIIVMGMVVDHAIVVAENITRLRSKGVETVKAAVEGTSFVFFPVIASIVTTCAAFLPIFFFTGRFSLMVKFIPPIIFLMLFGSLFESLFILPAHMSLKIPRLVKVIFSLGTLPLVEKYFTGRKKQLFKNNENGHWFHKVEDFYERILVRVLTHRSLLLISFGCLFIVSMFIFGNQLKYVMYPSAETTQFRLDASAPPDTKRFQTAKLSKQIEDVFSKYIGKEVVGFRTEIARSRWGSAVEENRLSMRIEILPKEKREKSLNELIREWEKQLKTVKGFEEIKIVRQRFGQASGSPIEILVQENDDMVREIVAREISEAMEKHPSLVNIEIDTPIRNPEYKIDLKRDLVKKLGINAKHIASTFRTILEGTVLYKLIKDDEEIHVRISAVNESKNDMNNVLDIPVGNEGSYLVPLNKIVNIKKESTPNSISRKDLKRVTTIYAGLNENKKATPLEIAERFEAELFPKIMSKYPTTVISFGGEVKDTRESQSNLTIAIIMVVLLIYIILVLLFNSLLKPFIILLSIPFGAVGAILAFWAHNITTFGFYASIGILGLSGVVVNDSILMITKLDSEYEPKKDPPMTVKKISNIAKTRLRAVVLTTCTTVAGLLPTAYGFAGYDSFLSEMMLAMAWGLVFGTVITLFLVPTLYSFLTGLNKL
ncbi:MAG: efflux RND transporter permease subunit, partial [Deltaproteobacteria bacterium]|nr:efflux RND transporter permease subunit [Deltaproteobacteria bacterium]